MTAAQSLLAAVFALAFLHLIMAGALYATRIPAMVKAKMSAQATLKPGALDSLPAWARNAAKNYNNLAEAPTAFYAVALALAVMGRADVFDAGLAWAYVGLRYIHSAVQATFNRVTVRFAVFSASWIVLGVLIVRGLLISL
ncbi:MAPEG family protein [Asticcacaulis solisilvae]|uniref:MAPEG family protein n=1 Tax=Asticcacaulis solisilvae TaxID=1217274 RepID=UPI003FD8C355